MGATEDGSGLAFRRLHLDQVPQEKDKSSLPGELETPHKACDVGILGGHWILQGQSQGRQHRAAHHPAKMRQHWTALTPPQ